MTNVSHVLLIDDEPTLLFALKSSFARAGWQADTACTLAEATQLLVNRAFDLIVCDVRLGTESAFNLLPHVKMHSRAALLFLTAYATVPDAVRAIHGGAFDYLTKPVSFEHLLRVATRIISDKQRQHTALFPSPQPSLAFDPALSPVSEEAWRALAAADETILLLGANGVGKRTFARVLHSQSRRRHGPCLTVECGGGDAVQLARELFGEEDNVFANSRPVEAAGCAAAHGGTLVLNHAEQLPASLQRRIAQIIATGVLSRAGSPEPVPADIRVIACAQTQRAPGISPGISVLESVPGLRTVQFPAPRERETEALTAERFPPQRAHPATLVQTPQQFESSQARTMQELERLHLEKTLAQVQGNRTHAAELLGISVRTMRNKIRQYDLAPRRYA